MPTVTVYNIQHQQVGSLDLDDAVFAAPVKEHLFYDMVRYQLAARRAGTHAVKGRAQVSGGGRKPWRQKGIGLGLTICNKILNQMGGELLVESVYG